MSSNSPSEGSEPKYVWFADFVRRQIQDGDLKPGDKLPSRSEIYERFQIAQPTIERALAVLEKEGVIIRRARQGVFIADRPEKTNQAPADTDHIMSSMIAVVTPHGRQVNPGHHQMGWSDFITQGALSACPNWNKHALMLHPDCLKERGVEEILRNPPLGFIFPSLNSRNSLDEMQWLLKELKKRSIPVVVFGDEPEFDEFDRVASDQEMGGYMLTRYLIQRGHERILPFYPASNNGLLWLQRRHEGYRRAMKEAGLEPMPICEYTHDEHSTGFDDTPAKFERTLRHRSGFLLEYLGREKRCDAILSISDGDVYVLAAICRLMGYEPNKDVVLAGYDNIWRDAVERNFADVPPVVTVDKGNWRLGRDLVNLLMARFAGKVPLSPQLWLVEPELVILGKERGREASVLTQEFSSSPKAA